jgi:tetratricopeptide (TPR) repeat protein
MTRPRRSTPLSRARFAVGIALAALTALVASPEHVASAQSSRGKLPHLSDEAARHFRRGLAAYDAARYEDAIAEFHAAYDVEPRRELLFSWAQAERLSGDCTSAIALYRRFLAAQPPPREADHAASQLARCEAALATQPPGAGAPAPPGSPSAASATPAPDAPSASGAPDASASSAPGAAPSAQVPPPPKAPADAAVPGASSSRTAGEEAPARSSRAPWYTDGVADALGAVGLVSIGVGAAFLGASASASSSARSAVTYGDYTELHQRAESDRVIGAIALGAGGVLVVVALVKYAVGARADGGASTARRARPAPGMLSW